MVFCPYLLRPPGAFGAIKDIGKEASQKENAGPVYAGSVGSQSGEIFPSAKTYAGGKLYI